MLGENLRFDPCAAYARTAYADRPSACCNAPRIIEAVAIGACSTLITRSVEQFIDFEDQVFLNDLADFLAAELIKFGGEISLGALDKGKNGRVRSSFHGVTPWV